MGGIVVRKVIERKESERRSRLTVTPRNGLEGPGATQHHLMVPMGCTLIIERTLLVLAALARWTRDWNEFTIRGNKQVVPMRRKHLTTVLCLPAETHRPL